MISDPHLGPGITVIYLAHVDLRLCEFLPMRALFSNAPFLNARPVSQVCNLWTRLLGSDANARCDPTQEVWTWWGYISMVWPRSFIPIAIGSWHLRCRTAMREGIPRNPAAQGHADSVHHSVRRSRVTEPKLRLQANWK